MKGFLRNIEELTEENGDFAVFSIPGTISSSC